MALSLGQRKVSSKPKGGVILLPKGRRLLIFSTCCLFLALLFILLLLDSNLPDPPNPDDDHRPQDLYSRQRWQPQVRLGELGDTMLGMLPDDLTFTVFVPSEEAFEGVLGLSPPHDSTARDNDTFAVLSRVMGFSTVPQHLPSRAVPLREEIALESVSGFVLQATRDSDGVLVINGIRSKLTDIRRGEIIVHVIHGVIMDPVFAQSFPRL